MTQPPDGRGASGRAGWLFLRDHLTVVAADEAACSLIGAPAPESLAGRTLTSLVAAGDGPSVRALHTAAATSAGWRGTLRFMFATAEVALEVELAPGQDANNALLRLAPAPAAGPLPAPGEAPLHARIEVHEALTQLAAPAAARSVLQALRQAVPFDWAAVVRFAVQPPHEAGAEVIAVYPSPMAGVAPGARWQPLGDEEARLLADAQPSLTNDLPPGGSTPLARLNGFGIRARLMVPLFAAGRVAGYAVAYRYPPHGFTPADGIHAETTLRPLGAAIALLAEDAGRPAPVPSGTTTSAEPAAALEQRAGPPAPVPPMEPLPRLGLLGDLVAGVAHELNNPLTSILGYAQILSSLEGVERDQAIHTIETEAVRASRIVRNLLSFARQRPPERQPVDLERVLRRVIDLRRYSLEMDDIRVVPRFGHVPEVMADESQMEEAFLHLLNNAHQALEQRGGEITVSTATAAAGDRVRVTFVDNGPGIPDEVRSRIFEPFFTTREVGAGQGMGLAIVHGVVAGHGGRTWVESAPGGGAQIVVELPAAAPPPATATVTPPGRRILVVDDEAPIRALTQEILVAAGYEVTTASTGAEAVRRLEATSYDVLITDLRMPEMGGAELYDIVRERWPALVARMLVVTGDIEGDRSGRLLAREQVRYLEKPFGRGDLLAAVSTLLQPGGEEPHTP